MTECRRGSFQVVEITLTPVARLEVLNDVQTARVERRKQVRQANDLMLWNVTPVVYNYVVSVVLRYARRFGKEHSINSITDHTNNKEVGLITPEYVILMGLSELYFITTLAIDWRKPISD